MILHTYLSFEGKSIFAILNLDLLLCFHKALKRKSGGAKSAEKNMGPGCSSVIKGPNQTSVLRKAGKPQKVPGIANTVKIGSHILMANVGESLPQVIISFKCFINIKELVVF